MNALQRVWAYQTPNSFGGRGEGQNFTSHHGIVFRFYENKETMQKYLVPVLLALAITGCGQNTQTSVQPTQPTSATAAPAVATVASGSTKAPVPTSAPTQAAVAAPTVARAGPGEFQNPVLRADFADPGILQVDDTYYAYATNAIGKNIQVASSTDLVTWKQLPDAMPSLASWAKLGGSLVWAPEVMKIGDKYVLYYTARDKASNRQCIGVAISDNPQGRFRDSNDAPFICQPDEGGSIDASPFQDGETLYIYWKNDGNCCAKATYLYVQELAPDGLSLVGESTRLVRNDMAWEGNLVEAPTMVKHEDNYFLFFSANDYAGPKYAVGYAACESAIGPCQDAPENPIVSSRMKELPLIVGPGHQDVFEANGETWMAYHAWEITSAGLRGGRRFLYIDRLDWQDGNPMLNGPNTAPQPKPIPAS